MDKKKYNSPPLPFKGNKRNWLKKIKEIVSEYPDDFTFLDLFGGSGIISHTIKQLKPNSRVIYNDYEDFINTRVAKIDQTNHVLNEVKKYINSKKIPTETRLAPEQKAKVVEILDYYNKKYRGLDVYTLSSCLCFSGKQTLAYDIFLKSAFYNNLVKKEYNAEGYLAGVERVSDSYKNIINNLNLDFNKLLIIADPPYLDTDNDSYNFYEKFKLKQFLELIQLFKYKNILFFSSSKSHTLDLLEFYAQANKQALENLNNIKVFSRLNSLNHSSKYTELLYLCKSL